MLAPRQQTPLESTSVIGDIARDVAVKSSLLRHNVWNLVGRDDAEAVGNRYPSGTTPLHRSLLCRTTVGRLLLLLLLPLLLSRGDGRQVNDADGVRGARMLEHPHRWP